MRTSSANIGDAGQSDAGTPSGAAAPGARADDVWSCGDLIVAERNATLPPYCVKTNRDEGGRPIRLRVARYHPAILLALLIHPLLFVILALALGRRARITVTISDEARTARTHAIVLTWGLVVAGISGVPLAATFRAHAGAFFVLSAGALLAALVTYALKARILHAVHIGDRHVWLRGACSEFLARLPVAPSSLRW